MKSSVRLFRIASVVAFFLIAVLQTVSYLSMFGNPNENYFNPKAPLPTVALTLALVWTALGIVMAFVLKSPESHPLPSAVSRIDNFLTASGYLAAAAILWFSLSNNLAKVTTLLLLAAACGMAASALLSKLSNATRALLGFLPAIACALLAVVFYFEKRLEMNAPLKISVMTGILLVMIYHTQQIRTHLGLTTPRLLCGISNALIGIGALSAIPVPIAFLTGVFNRSETVTTLPKLASILRNPECLAGALIVLCVSATVLLQTILSITEKQTENPESFPSPERSEIAEEES